MKKISYIIFLISICFLILLYLIPTCFPKASTKYSKNFNIDVFNKIEIGDKRRTVDSLLGEPLYISTENIYADSIKLNYWYSKPKTLFMEYNKVIIQFHNDKVINKVEVLDGD